MSLDKIISFTEFRTNENLVFGDEKKEKSFKEGDTVIYLLKGKKIEDWNNLSDEEKSNPTKKPTSEIIGIKPIDRIDGDKIVFKSKDGEDIIKTKDQIVGDVATDEENKNESIDYDDDIIIF
jgi:hypothetical protein